MKELLNIKKYQIEERSVVVLVLNKESESGKDASMKTLLRGDQLKYIDVEGRNESGLRQQMRGEEQIKSDEVENVATGEVKIGEFGRVGKEHHLKSTVMNGVKIGTVDQDGRENVQVNHKRPREMHS